MTRLIKDFKMQLGGKWWFHSNDNCFIESFLTLIINICDHLPRYVKKIIVTLIDNIGLLLFRLNNIIFPISPSYYLIQGNQISAQKNISFLVKGGPDYFSSLIDTICNSITVKEKISNQIGGKIITGHNNLPRVNYDILLIKSDSFYQQYYQKKGYIIIPEYISFHLDTTENQRKILANVSEEIKEDIDKAKKTGYTYELCNDLEMFELFYYQMYLPYTRWKHQHSKKIASFAAIRHLAAQGAQLLIIKHKNNPIFGGMFIKRGDELKTHYAGLKEGKFNHLHNGIMALSYYFLIEIAKKYHCNNIDFGTASPFLHDGLYQYKNKWNMKKKPSSPFFSDIYAIKILKKDSAFSEFISTHPIHYLNNKKLDILSKNQLEENYKKQIRQ